MTTSIIPTIHNYYRGKQQHQDNPSQYCTLRWRRGQLLVVPPGQVKQPYMASLHKMQLLVECIKHSPVNLVRVDPKLGEARLRLWADASEQAGKPIFLRIPCINKQPKSSNPLSSGFKRLTDWIAALMFLLVISPVIVGLFFLMRVYSQEPIFSCQWHIGERGKLFKVIKFRTTTATQKTLEDVAYQTSLYEREDEHEVTPIGRWMRRYGLDNLPQLFNVLKGEMSLTGPRCWSLADAVRLSPEGQRQLNKLPGIIGSWGLEAESNLLHLDNQIL